MRPETNPRTDGVAMVYPGPRLLGSEDLDHVSWTSHNEFEFSLPRDYNGAFSIGSIVATRSEFSTYFIFNYLIIYHLFISNSTKIDNKRAMAH